MEKRRGEIPPDFRILGPQVTRREEGGRRSGRMENGKTGEGGRARKEGREKRRLHTLTTFLTPTDPPLTPLPTGVASYGRETGSESDRARGGAGWHGNGRSGRGRAGVRRRRDGTDEEPENGDGGKLGGQGRLGGIKTRMKKQISDC